MKNQKYRRGIFIVAYIEIGDEIKYLILKRKLHWNGWEFPKGGKKSYENYLEGVKREVLEETGEKPLKIIKLKLNGRYKYPKKLEDRPNVVGQTYKLYAAKIKKEKIKFDKIEHSGYEWVDFKTAIKKLTWKNQRKCLKVANSYLMNGEKK